MVAELTELGETLAQKDVEKLCVALASRVRKDLKSSPLLSARFCSKLVLTTSVLIVVLLRAHELNVVVRFLQTEVELDLLQPSDAEGDANDGAQTRKVRLLSIENEGPSQRSPTAILVRSSARLRLRRNLHLPFALQKEHAVQALTSVATVARVLVDLCPSG